MRRAFLALGLVFLVVAGLIGIARATSPTVDGIPCEFGEGAGYHVHAHLTIVLAGSGKLVHPPANTGIETLHLCLFWLHTHDDSGIIHIEAPHKISLTLGQFFDIWGQPLSRSRVWDYPTSPSRLRVYVGSKRYAGDPRSIRLGFHTAVTIELGPPYISPPKPNFSGL
jgi:hypothetical protein